jgi:ABC-type uncharacterized transport system substrate-binding protein
MGFLLQRAARWVGFLVLIGMWPRVGAVAQTLCVVKGAGYPEFQEAAEGFWEGVADRGHSRRGAEYLLGSDSREVVADGIRKQSPALVFAVGARAAQWTQEVLPDIPMVFALVYDPVRAGILGGSGGPRIHTSGVIAAVPPAVQWQALKPIYPGLACVGLLYSRNGIAVFEAVKDLLQSEGVAVEAQLIRESGDPAAALAQMSDIDLFWMTPDPTAFSVWNREAVFRSLRERGVPILAPSPKFLQGSLGADIAICVDPRRNGRQAAEIALDLLSGEGRPLLPEAPRDWTVFVKAGRSGLPSGINVTYVR